MKTTLISVLWKKEKIHWGRVKSMFGKFKGWPSKLTFGLLVAVFVTIFHYLFAAMHTIYEIFLFIFARDAFRSNLNRLAVGT